MGQSCDRCGDEGVHATEEGEVLCVDHREDYYNEKFYDEKIAPVLLDLGKQCLDHGLSLCAVVEYAPGVYGRTSCLQKSCGIGVLLTDMAARAEGNIDALVIAAKRHANQHGHTSIILKLLDVYNA